MNRYLQRTMLSLLVCAVMNGWYLIEGLAFGRESWHSILLAFFFTPVSTIGEMILPSGHDFLHLVFFPLGFSIIFWIGSAWIVLTAYHWVRTGKL